MRTFALTVLAAIIAINVTATTTERKKVSFYNRVGRGAVKCVHKTAKKMKMNKHKVGQCVMNKKCRKMFLGKTYQCVMKKAYKVIRRHCKKSKKCAKKYGRKAHRALMRMRRIVLYRARVAAWRRCSRNKRCRKARHSRRMKRVRAWRRCSRNKKCSKGRVAAWRKRCMRNRRCRAHIMRRRR